jgi:hypothetical protein
MNTEIFTDNTEMRRCNLLAMIVNIIQDDNLK